MEISGCGTSGYGFGRVFRHSMTSLALRFFRGGWICVFGMVVSAAPVRSANLSKPEIGGSTYVDWPHIVAGSLSEDGRYASYYLGSAGKLQSLELAATTGTWRLEIKDAQFVGFTGDSHRGVVQKTDGE